ncbi:MAG: hypothetical protein V1493_00830, partial [Candidatus Diapherotrites archaeon]
MLKILKLAWKELKLIKSQRISLALTMVYPVLVVLTLAIAFSGNDFFKDYLGQSGLDKVDIAVFLPQDSNNFDSSDFLEKISDYKSINVLQTKSPDMAREAVRMRIARVGIVVGDQKTENKQVDVNIFLDNSALLASRTIGGYAKIGLENVRYKKSQEILNSIWKDIKWIESKLYEQRGKVDEFIASMGEGRARLKKLQDKINSIKIAPMLEKMDKFDAEYLETKAAIKDSRKDLADAKTDLGEYKAKLISTKSRLLQYKGELGGIRDDVSDARSIAIGPLATNLAQIEADLAEKISEIDATITEIDSAIEKIDQTKAKIEKSDSTLVKADAKLDNAKGTVAEFKDLLKVLQETVNETNATIEDAFESQEKTEADLNTTKKLFSSLIGTLAEFQKYDPGFLVNPLNVTEFNLYPVDDLAIMSPVSLALVLLLTTVLLAGVSVLRERSYGVDFRVMLSPTSKPMWLAGKILGQMLFAFFEAGIIFAMVFLVFGVPLAGSPE